MHGTRRGRSSPGFRAAAALLGLGVALLLGEGLARWRDPPLASLVRQQLRPGSESTMVVPVSDGRVYAGRPGWAGDGVSLNALGLRGVAGGEGCRVAVVGDSVAFGWSMEWSETVAGRLHGRGAATWTVALPGWNTAQEAAALARLDVPWDAVVVLWVPNDAASLEWERPQPDGSLAMYVEHRVPLLGVSEGLTVAAWRRSALVRAALRGLAGLGITRGEVLLEEREHRAALAAIAEAAGGAPVVLAQVPPLVDYAGWEQPWGAGRAAAPYTTEPAWRAAEEEGRRLGMAVVDLTEAFAGTRPTSLALAPGDRVHPGPEGHRRMAAVLARELATLGCALAGDGG